MEFFFRRKSVSVYSPHMKEIHRGISGETEIIACMEKALFILHNKSIPPLIRISVFHYLFGYIHPFYDGTEEQIVLSAVIFYPRN